MLLSVLLSVISRDMTFCSMGDLEMSLVCDNRISTMLWDYVLPSTGAKIGTAVLWKGP